MVEYNLYLKFQKFWTIGKFEVVVHKFPVLD